MSTGEDQATPTAATDEQMLDEVTQLVTQLRDQWSELGDQDRAVAPRPRAPGG